MSEAPAVALPPPLEGSFSLATVIVPALIARLDDDTAAIQQLRAMLQDLRAVRAPVHQGTYPPDGYSYLASEGDYRSAINWLLNYGEFWNPQQWGL